MSLKRKILRILGIMGLALVGLYLILSAMLLSHGQDEMRCTGYRVILRGQEASKFLSSEVRMLLRNSGLKIQGQRLDQINTAQIEEVLQKSALIDRVECYKSPDSLLRMEIYPRNPILRVLNSQGESFYLDDKGDIIPRSLPEAMRLPLVTGHASKEYVQKELYGLAQFLQEDGFWRSQTEQINILADETVEIIPRIGDHVLFLGSIRGFQDKLKRVRKFYELALSQIGWNKYSRINVEIGNQIICTKRNQ